MPAKRKQKSLKKTTNTTTYKKGGCTGSAKGKRTTLLTTISKNLK